MMRWGNMRLCLKVTRVIKATKRTTYSSRSCTPAPKKQTNKQKHYINTCVAITVLNASVAIVRFSDLGFITSRRKKYVQVM